MFPKIQLICVFFIQYFCSSQGEFKNEYQIGMLESIEDSLLATVFKIAVESEIQNQTVGFKTKIIKVLENNAFDVQEIVCLVAKDGIAGIVSSELSNSHISVCNALEIPCLLSNYNEMFTINLYPSPKVLREAYKDLLEALNWNNFMIIYDAVDELLLLEDSIEKFSEAKKVVVFQKLPSGDDFIPFLRSIRRESGIKNFVIACDTELTSVVLNQAHQVGMMNEDSNFVLTTLDIHSLNLDKLKYSDSKIYAYLLVDQGNPVFTRLTAELNKGTRTKNAPEKECKIADSIPVLTTKMAVLYDSIQILKEAIQNGGGNGELSLSADCERGGSSRDGHDIQVYMKINEVPGLTGMIRFDNNGNRRGISLKLVESTESGFQYIETWTDSKKDDSPRLKFVELKAPSDINEQESQNLVGKTLIVTTIMSTPFLMLKRPEYLLRGNDRYEGYTISLLEELSRILGFEYVIKESERYGEEDETGSWNGMIGDLKEGRANLSVADLTVTPARQKVVDFSMPFISSGISILYTELKLKPPSWLSFMFPFSMDLWICMGITALCVSLIIFIIARVTPYEACPESRNQFSIRNVIWFALSSLLQQGSHLSPRSFSLRILAAFWWFFTLVLVSSYAANLATLSIVREYDTSLNSVEDLVSQDEVKFGCVAGGRTCSYFRHSQSGTEKKIWDKMSSMTPSPFKDNNTEGVDAVLEGNGKYAFFLESFKIEYFVETRCGLRQLGNQLNSNGFSIGLPKNSTYLRQINGAILLLKEQGILEALRKKWWSNDQKKIYCPESSGIGENIASLHIENLAGIFIGLIIACLVAMALTFGEVMWKIRLKRKENIQF